ncbi:MAG: T9SS type A sorting domain-containing protein [Candidatus Kapaibacterium sp.]
MAKFLLLLVFFAMPGMAQAEEMREGSPIEKQKFEMMKLVSPNTGEIPDNIFSEEHRFAERLNNDYLLKPTTTEEFNWIQYGPTNLGGRTRALAMDVTNEKILLAGGVSGGLWRTIDGGKSWAKVTPPDFYQGVSCITQNKSKGKTNIWYYGTGEGIGNSASASDADYLGHGIFKSTDNGMSWFQLEATASNTPVAAGYDYIWSIAADHSVKDKDVVLAAVNRGIIRSEDGGQTWDYVLGNDAKKGPNFTEIIISDDGIKYAALSRLTVGFDLYENYGIYRSTDGINWTKLDVEYPHKYSGRSKLALAKQKGKEILFILINFSNKSFLIEHDVAEKKSQTYELTDLNVFSGYCMSLSVKPDDPEVIFYGGTNLYRLTKKNNQVEIEQIGGYNQDFDLDLDWKEQDFTRWEEMITQGHWVDQHDFIFLPSNPDVAYSACDGGVYKTNNCMAEKIKWEHLNNGYITNQFYTVDINEDVPGDNRIIGGMQDKGTFITDDRLNGKFEMVNGGDGSFCHVSRDYDHYWVSSQYGSLFRNKIDDNYEISEAEPWFDLDVNEPFFFIAPFVVEPISENRMFLASRRSIWRNNNLRDKEFRNNWQRIFDYNNSSEIITSLTISKNPEDILFYSKYSQNDTEIVKVENASSNDLIKKTICTGIIKPASFINCIEVDPVNADNLMVIVTNYDSPSIYHTSDGGSSWNDVSGNLEENPDGSGNGPSCRWAEIMNYRGTKYYFVCTSIGLFSTTKLDGENTVWKKEGAESIGNSIVTMISARESDGFIAVATHGNGLFTGYPGSSSYAKNTKFYLADPMPNPADYNTRLTFYLDKNSNCRLEIYDIAGKKMNEIKLNNCVSGKNERDISINSLSTGAYILKLLNGNNSSSTKLIVR